MNNIDQHLNELVKVQIEQLKPEFSSYFSDEKISAIILCLIKSEMNNHIINETSKFITNNNSFIEETIEGLFCDKNFIDQLKSNLIIKLRRDSSYWD